MNTSFGRIAIAALVFASVLSTPAARADAVGPVISVWDGLDQTFELPGTPQPFINILGNVADVDGVASLTYSLNSGPDVVLTMGTGTSDLADRRLVAVGDFNIDLNIVDLDGSAVDDTVVISAEDTVGNTSTETVIVDYIAPASTWPLPYAIDWSSQTAIGDAAQIIDGKWSLSAAGARTLDPGYDRQIAIGDVTWTDYVVSVPVTVHSLGNPGGGIAGAVGFATGWQGHTDEPAGFYSDGACGGSPLTSQPNCGSEPIGVLGRYRTNGVLELAGDGNVIYDSIPMTLDEGKTYVFKLRVEQAVAAGNIFSMKVWAQGTEEPASWQVRGQEPPGPDNGSLVLTSHHDDVTFGDVTIAPLSTNPPMSTLDHGWILEPLSSTEIDVVANDAAGDLPIVPKSVLIVSEPANGSVSVDPATGVVTYTHTAAGTATDAFAYTVDDTADTGSSPTPVVIAVGDLAFESDDFNEDTLDTRWAWTPAAAGSFEMVGAKTGDAHIAISVPAGTPHDKFGGGDAPRVMQDALDIDFVIDAKFNADPTSGSNGQGIIIEEDANRWLRFSVEHTGSELKAFIGNTVGGVTGSVFNAPITGPANYLRVDRAGDDFTFSYSGDGSSWTVVGGASTEIEVASVGAFAANPFGEAYTAELDYFFHVAAPIDPEDPPLALTDEVLLVEPSGKWHIRVPGNPDYTFFYGVPGDVPLFGDWDGDGIDTPGAYRVGPGGGFAYLTNTLPPDGGVAVADFDFFFGIPGDEVLIGDWDGDGDDTLGVNRNGHIFLTDTNGSGGAPVPTDHDFWFGVDGDRAFGGDADGDGEDSVYLYRETSGFIYYTNEAPVGPGAVATTADTFFFGVASDLFVSGDWDDDGDDTAGIYRPSVETLFLSNTNGTGGGSAPTDDSYVWGTEGWKPVAGVTGLS